MRKFTQVYNLINESEIEELYPMASDTFSNVNFKDRVVGTSTPSSDRINPSLLKDVQTAASKAGVNIDITTAVSGHRKGTRHEKGNAVDVAMIDGQSWSDRNSAQKKGILTAIEKFVSALESLGYEKNVKESGNQKVVLTFGYDGHNNHIHISNNTDTASQIQTSKTEDLPTPDEDDTKQISPELSKALSTLSSGSKGLDLFGGKLDPLLKGFEKTFSKMNEEVERIKNLMK